jgi:hypothetical protein
MTPLEDRDRWAALVAVVQPGDASAWPELIDRFEDIAVASAVGLCGDLDEATGTNGHATRGSLAGV